MVFNATFNNISVISGGQLYLVVSYIWWSVLLVEETGKNPEKTTYLP
jgi:hypothetical protein